MPALVLAFSDEELAVLDRLANAKNMTRTTLMRQALRTYQWVDTRLESGGRIFFENDKKETETLEERRPR